ncbi:MAG: hypothetical protein WAN86_04255 [Hyphomicrobiaceae bacterium]
MFLLRSPAVAVWLLAGAGASSTGAAWAGNGQTGKLHPWVLVAVFWGVALLSVSVHYLRQYLAQAAAWAWRSWHQSAPERARLMRRARLHIVHTSGAVGGSARQLIRSHPMLESAWSLARQGWEAARRASEQQMAGARRAPGALIGWSRSALKALRA